MRLLGWKLPVVFGAVVRVLTWAAGLWSEGWVQTDTYQYWNLASDRLLGYWMRGGLPFEWGLMRPPGYPAILALVREVHDSHAAAAFLQVWFGVAAIALTYVIARRLADPVVAGIAAWWLALSPLHIVDSSVLLTEVPFSVFLLLGILLVSPLKDEIEGRTWRWATAGVALAIATLIRPITLYLPVFVLLVVALSKLRRRLFVPALALLLVFALPIGAWIARNHALTGVATMSTIQGFNLAYYRAAGAIAAEERISIDEARQRVDSLVRAQREPGMNLGDLSRVQTRLGIREIRDHPLGYSFAAARGLAYMLLGAARSHITERFFNTPLQFLSTPLSILSGLSAALLTIASLVGSVAWVRRREWLSLSAIAVPLGYLLIVSAGYEAWARFRVPLEPLLAILAGVGVRAIAARLSTTRSRATLRRTPA